MSKLARLCDLAYLILLLSSLIFQMCNKFLHFSLKKHSLNNNKRYQITDKRFSISKKKRSFLIKYLSPLLVEGRPNSPGN